MREIKFRAWDYNHLSEKWEIIDYEQIKNNSLRYVTDNESYPNRKIMQFTGLRDKNKKEIYEGDIVRFSDSEYYEKVYFDEGSFTTEGINYPINRKAIINKGVAFNLYTIIGNIHENPELIK